MEIRTNMAYSCSHNTNVQGGGAKHRKQQLFQYAIMIYLSILNIDFNKHIFQ